MSGKKCPFLPCNGKDNDFKMSGSKGIATLFNRSEELSNTAIHEILSNIITPMALYQPPYHVTNHIYLYV